MRLTVTTPYAVVLDAEGVREIRAEDETGAFGIRPGHADFVTTLPVSVMSWTDGEGAEHQVAVRGGVLAVHRGEAVEVAAREAVGEDTLSKLGLAVLERLREEEQSERESAVSTTRLQLAAIRYVQRYLEAGRPGPRGESLGGAATLAEMRAEEA